MVCICTKINPRVRLAELVQIHVAWQKHIPNRIVFFLRNPQFLPIVGKIVGMQVFVLGIKTGLEGVVGSGQHVTYYAACIFGYFEVNVKSSGLEIC